MDGPTSPAPLRVNAVGSAPVQAGADYVLYWMIANRRLRWNFALDRAVDWARELGKPLVVLEALRVAYPWASARMHRFVLDGMAANADAAAPSDLTYYPYAEPAPGAGSGLLEALAGRACVVVTDEFPCFFLPRMVAAAAARLDVRVEAVDSCGLLPLRASERAFPTAYSFRSFLQKTLEPHLDVLPRNSLPGRGTLPALERLPKSVASGWPRASAKLLGGDDPALAELPIDAGVAPVALRGGYDQGVRVVRRFLDERLDGYLDRNQPEADSASGLSPYLHFGHVSTHQVFRALALQEDWTPDALDGPRGGKREGWWHMRAPAEAFLDQIVTWRELGFQFAFHRDDYDRYESLPDWARETLEAHAGDEREFTYDLAEFEAARTHDEIWNAAQRQLLEEGVMHNYLRMLWGKKILEWTPSPQAALEVMVELNNKYALDGRDPNSYSGIFWTLGRFDRPWAPERPIFGRVRFMSSANTARKLRIRSYLERYGTPTLFD